MRTRRITSSKTCDRCTDPKYLLIQEIWAFRWTKMPDSSDIWKRREDDTWRSRSERTRRRWRERGFRWRRRRLRRRMTTLSTATSSRRRSRTSACPEATLKESLKVTPKVRVEKRRRRCRRVWSDDDHEDQEAAEVRVNKRLTLLKIIADLRVHLLCLIVLRRSS